MDRSRNDTQPVVEGMDAVRPVACEERRRRETLSRPRRRRRGGVISWRRHLPKVEVQKTSETDAESAPDRENFPHLLLAVGRRREIRPTRRPFLNISELQLWEDGVSTISRHRDAVDVVAREFRDGAVPRRPLGG